MNLWPSYRGSGGGPLSQVLALRGNKLVSITSHWSPNKILRLNTSILKKPSMQYVCVCVCVCLCVCVCVYIYIYINIYIYMYINRSRTNLIDRHQQDTTTPQESNYCCIVETCLNSECCRILIFKPQGNSEIDMKFIQYRMLCRQI